MTPIYRADTTILIQQPTTPTTTDFSALQASERLAKTYAQMMTKNPILERVIETLGLEAELSPGKMQSMIQVALVRDTQLIDVSVEDTDAARAALIANALVAEFARQTHRNCSVLTKWSKSSARCSSRWTW